MKCESDVKVRIYGENGTQGFGKGICQILEGVEQYGSINKATKAMGMAYSKAWKMITRTEAEFGVSLLDRYGVSGSSLTPEAKKLMRCYKEMSAAAKAMADKRMLDILGPSKNI